MDAVIAVLAFLALIVPFLLAKLWGWVALWIAIALALGVVEGLSYLTTRRTISQQFWEFRRQHRIVSWVLIGLMTAAWLGLIAHLLWKG